MLKSAIGLAAVFITRGIGAVGGVSLSLIIAQLAGADGLGQFTVFLSFLGIFAILARRGLDTILIRTVALIEHAGIGGRLPAILRHGAHTALGGALVLCLPGAVLLGSGFLGKAIPSAELVFAISLPMVTLLGVIAGYIKGTGRPWLAPLFEMGGVSLAATLLIATTLAIGYRLDLVAATILFACALFALSVCAVLVVAQDMARRYIPSEPLEPFPKERAELRQGQLAYTAIALSGFAVQAGSFAIVAPFLSEEALGLARAAERLALIVSFPILAINPFIAARVVRHVQSGCDEALWRLIMKSSLGGAAIALPVLALLLAAPEIPLIYFGTDFVRAAPYLGALALAHFLLVLLGPFPMVMNMGGGEKEMMWVSFVTVAIAVVLYPLAAFWFGVEGFLSAYVLCSVGRAAIVGALATKLVMAVSKRSGTALRELDQNG
ncbi:MAG: hypothetical protein L0H73_04105 [Nitrococcus sp.]|nr:hypothetical protein [Nitrococcus sp.]